MPGNSPETKITSIFRKENLERFSYSQNGKSFSRSPPIGFQKKIFQKISARQKTLIAGQLFGNLRHDPKQHRSKQNPFVGLLYCGTCGGAMGLVHSKKKNKRCQYYICTEDTKRGEKCCPVGKIGSATIEDAVRDQAKKIFETTFFQERIAARTGIMVEELREYFNDAFWKESNPQELNRLFSELFEKIILKENQIAYEIKTSGVQALIEGVTNEHQ